MLDDYHATWKQGLHKTHFGFPRFRVLTITNSAERMQNMIEACGELEGGQGLFLFADATIVPKSDPLAYRWRNGNNELMLITD